MGKGSRKKELREQRRKSKQKYQPIEQLPWAMLEQSQEFCDNWREARKKDFLANGGQDIPLEGEREALAQEKYDEDLAWDMLTYRIPLLLTGLYQQGNPILWEGNSLYFLMCSDLVTVQHDMSELIPIAWLVHDVDGRYLRRLGEDPSPHLPINDACVDPIPTKFLGLPVQYLDTGGAIYSPAAALIAEVRTKIIQPKSRIIPNQH